MDINQIFKDAQADFNCPQCKTISKVPATLFFKSGSEIKCPSCGYIAIMDSSTDSAVQDMDEGLKSIQRNIERINRKLK